jgi:polysaccharide export outer membrane protein
MVFLGQVDVAGRTISEARDTIEKGLEPYVKHPVVGVTVLEVASETVTVSGAVARPGLYNISGSTRLADAYALAGGSAERLFNGVDVDVADLEHSIVVRDGEILPVDFKLAIEGRGLGQNASNDMQLVKLNNIKLNKGDYIFVAQRMESSVTICGEVRSPHRRLYEPGMGLIETLTAAGWMHESHWSHVIIIRDGLSDPKMYKIDVDGILTGKCRNVYLKANDIVYVPKDNMSEYNVFIRKLLPTAQLVNLLTSRISAMSM